MRVRLRRLREPRYLVGAIAGAAYLYFTVFARAWRTRPTVRVGPRTPPPALTAFQRVGAPLVGVALLVMMAAGWLLPSDSTLLEFTEAETDFLFPAPISRRALLIHRLLRSQLGLLFAALVPALAFPSQSGWGRVRFAIAMWLILVTMRVHFTGVTLARASLGLRGVEARRRQFGALAVMLGAVSVVIATLVRVVAAAPAIDPMDLVQRAHAALSTGLPHVILWPFAALARPLFAPWPSSYLLALGPAVAVLAVNVAWMLTSDAALQDATVQAEARRAARRTRERPVARARAVHWTLPLSGRVESLFVWKSAMQALRAGSTAAVLRFVAPAIGLSVAATSIAVTATRSSGAAVALMMMACACAGFAVVFGPQIIRSDLRGDLLNLELLKTWPVRPAAVIRGEIAGPAAMLTVGAWAAILVALLFSGSALTSVALSVRLAVAAAAAVAAPALVAAQLTVHNAAAIVFPAWVPLGTQRPRGLDAVGQRLILFFGIAVALMVMLLPGVIPAALVWFVLRGVLGAAVFVPAALIVTAVVLVEVLIAIEALGPIYERMDLTDIERAE